MNPILRALTPFKKAYLKITPFNDDWSATFDDPLGREIVSPQKPPQSVKPTSWISALFPRRESPTRATVANQSDQTRPPSLTDDGNHASKNPSRKA